MNRSGYIAAVLWVACCYGQTAPRYSISTLAGSGGAGFSGDDGAASAAQLSSPAGVAVDASRNVLIADQFNHRIRKVAESGTITTAAGSATRGFAGDAAAATSAQLSAPCGVAVDSAGNIYVADSLNHVVRRISTTGTISTVAGNFIAGPGYAGDGGAATSSQLDTPIGVAVDSSGNLYIADLANNRVRKVSTSGTITTFAGNGAPSGFGDGTPASGASVNRPFGVAVDAAGNVYIGDTGNHRVRKVGTDGIITTVAGTGLAGYSGDSGPATAARLNNPSGVAVDRNGNLYIVDNMNSRVRVVNSGGTIATIAGNGRAAYGGDGGVATSASLFFPTGIAIDSTGNLYISDNQNNLIRKLTPLPAATLAPSIAGVIGAGAFGGLSAVPAGSWIEIYGSDLAANAREWTTADFKNQVPPTALDGTSVTIGGRPASVAYISGGQVNVLVPTGLASGSQTLTVSTPAGTSRPVALQIDPSKATIFAPPAFQIAGRQYAGATLQNGTAFALPGGVAGVNARPARRGETITIYGIGFGTVNGSAPPGAQGNALTGSLQIFLGETQADITYAGLSPGSVGLYQFNVVVPPGLSAESVPLTFTFNGVKGAQTVFAAVQE